MRALPAPPPLLSRGDDTAAALRAGNREFRAGIDEAAAFVSLTARVQNRRPRARLSLLALPAFALVAVAAIVAFRPRRTLPQIAAESIASMASARADGSQSVREEQAIRPVGRGDVARESARPTASAEPRPSAASPKVRRVGDAARQTRAPGVPPVTSAEAMSQESAQSVPSTKPSAAEPEAPPSGPDCLALARQGSTRDAELCFAERARGSGLGAEMALYELGRLRRNVLGEPKGALLALEEHMARFPSGSLRREVEMSYLELLVQVGRSSEALERSSALLAKRAGGERARELYLLRGDVFRRSLHDLRAAEREYAQAERLAGSAEAEATYLRGVCLEGLGEGAAAVEVYRRYLAKPARPRAADVQRRLERLGSP